MSSKSKQPDQTRIARAIFAAAESMGIADRKLVEQLTGQVIERLEQPKPLPGMEHLVSERGLKQKGRPADADIQSMVREILAQQIRPEEEPVMNVKTETTALDLSENALHVLERRYLQKDSQGQVIETPAAMFRRVARTIAAADLIYDPEADVGAREEEFYQLMTGLEFLPNSPTLMNAGTDLGQLAACFVLPVEDSMIGIFDAVKNMAIVHQSWPKKHYQKHRYC